jgi:hypothetical protein
MLRATPARLRRFGYSSKYPSVVSYNKLPWNVIRADSSEVHEYCAPQYVKLFRLAAQAMLPQLILPGHPRVPADKQLQLLPGMMYFLPGEGIELDTALGWAPCTAQLPDESLQFYDQLVRDVCQVSDVNVYKSGDLRLMCTAFTVTRWKVPVSRGSSLAELGGTGAGTFFHYFRPNRPHSELMAAFSRYNASFPVMDTLEAFQDTRWAPVLGRRKNDGGVRASPMPTFVPPTSYLTPPPERLGISPGGSFGRRSVMWGHWF